MVSNKSASDLHDEPEDTTTSTTPDIEKTAADMDTGKREEQDQEPEPPYSIFKIPEKRFITFMASLTTLFPALSSSVYYPVIPVLAKDLDVSVSDINLTVTVYLILQGLTPLLIGNLSDDIGRRPAIIFSFIVYIAACIGAAVKGSYAVLMVMRCLQSIGISSTISLSLAMVSDIVTSAERGSYTSYVQMGWMVGPTLGPVIGGLLSQYLGWRSIFWFLTIFASIMFVMILILLPETSRKIVGNGSIPAPRWNTSLLVYWHARKLRKAGIEPSSPASTTITKEHAVVKIRINPLRSIKPFLNKETCFLLLYSGLIYASSYMVMSTMPDQLDQKYALNTIQISLCYLATGFGALTSVLFTGRILDRNFRRHANLVGMKISTAKDQDLTNFPIELARLQVGLPLLLFGGVALVSYGWTLEEARTSLAAPMIFLYLQSFGYSSAFTSFGNLVMDLNRDMPGSASAAMNLTRCWLGAGGVGFVGPLTNAAGSGWMAVTIAGIWLVFSPLAFSVVLCGLKWREIETKK